MLEQSANTPWYYDKKKYLAMTLFDCLDKTKAPKRATGKPLRLPLQDVYKIQGIGTVPVGRIETGTLKPGMVCRFSPNGKTAEVKSVEMHHESMASATVGDNVGFNIKGLSIKDINRGHVASNSKNQPADKVMRFVGQVIVLNHNNIVDGYTPVLDCHTAHIACKFNTIFAQVDPRNGAIKAHASKAEKLCIRKNQACLVSLVPQKDMCVETFTEYAPLGRFAIRDMRRTVAVGVIKNIQREDQIGADNGPTGKLKKAIKGISALPFTRGDDFKWADAEKLVDGHTFGDYDCTINSAKVAE